MEHKNNKYYINYIPAFIIFVIIFKFIYQDNGLSKLFSIFIPILAAVFLSMILNPLMKIFQKIFRIRLIAIFISYAIFISFITMVAFIITPQIGRSVSGLIKDAPEIIKGVDNLFRHPPEFFSFLDTAEVYAFYQSNLPAAIQRITVFINGLLNKTLSGVIDFASALMNFFVAIIISIYILWDKEHFENLYHRVVYSFFEKDTSKQILKLLRDLNDSVIRFIFGKMFDSSIIAVISYIGIRYLIKADYPLIFALIIGIFNMIPYFGPFIGGIPVVLITLLIDPTKGLWMTLFIIVLQQFDGLLLGPKILGIQLNLKPIWIIAVIIIGGGLFGLWGMFFATPVAALLKTIINNYMEFKLNNQELDLPHSQKK
jgi:predicted PurR-regulated permease PerM